MPKRQAVATPPPESRPWVPSQTGEAGQWGTPPGPESSALRKAERIGPPPDKGWLYRVADWLTQGIEGGDPGAADALVTVLSAGVLPKVPGLSTLARNFESGTAQGLMKSTRHGPRLRSLPAQRVEATMAWQPAKHEALGKEWIDPEAWGRVFSKPEDAVRYGNAFGALSAGTDTRTTYRDVLRTRVAELRAQQAGVAFDPQTLQFGLPDTKRPNLGRALGQRTDSWGGYKTAQMGRTVHAGETKPVLDRHILGAVGYGEAKSPGSPNVYFPLEEAVQEQIGKVGAGRAEPATFPGLWHGAQEALTNRVAERSPQAWNRILGIDQPGDWDNPDLLEWALSKIPEGSELLKQEARGGVAVGAAPALSPPRAAAVGAPPPSGGASQSMLANLDTIRAAGGLELGDRAVFQGSALDTFTLDQAKGRKFIYTPGRLMIGEPGVAGEVMHAELFADLNPRPPGPWSREAAMSRAREYDNATHGFVRPDGSIEIVAGGKYEDDAARFFAGHGANPDLAWSGGWLGRAPTMRQQWPELFDKTGKPKKVLLPTAVGAATLGAAGAAEAGQETTMPAQQIGAPLPAAPPQTAPPGLRRATPQDIVRAEAKRLGVPEALALAMASAESGFDQGAVSPKGASGVMQLMPGTAKDLGVDPTNLHQNIRGGLAYFKQQLDANQGNVRLALAAYNAGPNRQGMPQETEAYITKILGALRGGQPAAAPPGERPPGMPALTAGPQPAEVTLSMQGEPSTPPVGAPPPRLPVPSAMERATTLEQPLGPVHVPKDDPTFMQSMMTGMDPRNPEGRRNLAGAAGSMAAGTLIGGPVGGVVGGLRALALSAIGAAVGGGVAEMGEQYVGEQPPDLGKVREAGLEQGLYDVGGQVITWPFKFVGRHVAGHFVKKYGADYLRTAREAVGKQLSTLLDDAVEKARVTSETVSDMLFDVGTKSRARVQVAKAAGAEALETTRAAGQGGLTAAQGLAREGVQGAQAQATQLQAHATEPYTQIAAPPSLEGPGTQVTQVLQGPAKAARKTLGEAVDDAARQGPEVDITALKAEAERIVTEELKPPATTFPARAAEEGVDPEEIARLAGVSTEQMAKLPPERQAAVQAFQDELAQVAESQRTETLGHPAMQVINKILNAEDTVPFYDAHLWKKELGAALGAKGTYDKSVKTQVEALTEHLQGGLREALSGFEPYDAATAAYGEVAKRFTKGIVPQLKRVALEDPGAAVKLLKNADAGRARMLRDLLVEQGGRAGAEAWDAVRSAWTRRKVVAGGIEGLTDRIDQLDPDFAQVLYGDEAGQQILGNLRAIHAGFVSAVEQGTELVAAAQAAGRTGVSTARASAKGAVRDTRRGVAQSLVGARQAGREELQATRVAGRDLRTDVAKELRSVRGAKRDFRQPTAYERAFQESSVGKSLPALAHSIVDAFRVGGLGLSAYWGAVSGLRLMMGPKANDLITWAAYSPKSTQVLVDIMTRPDTGMMLADFLRATGVFTPKEMQEMTDPYLGGPVGAPPPAMLPGGVGRPPPLPDLTRSPQSP